MKANSLSIRHFVNDPEAMERELLLKFFRFEGNRANVLQLEHIPAVLTAGCVVLCLKGGKTEGRHTSIRVGLTQPSIDKDHCLSLDRKSVV